GESYVRNLEGVVSVMLVLLLALLMPADSVLVIAHRGASGERPEHTLEAYRIAIEQGADVIEPDIVSTRDGVLIARHENEISETTDIAQRPAFADRRTTKVIDGVEVTGWFTEDLDLDEIKTLRAVERLPDLRPQSAAYDGQFEVATLDEIIALALEAGAARGRPVGLYPETKHPTHFRRIGLPLEAPLVHALHAAGWSSRTDPVWIQSFEIGNLELLRGMTDLRLVQLAYPGGTPADRPETPYDEMTTPDGLATVATYADAIGVAKSFVLEDDLSPSGLVEDAHRAGLEVHVWTIRAENAFLPPVLRDGDDPAVQGDLGAEVRALEVAGVDGMFSDHPGLVLRALGR
ncbi:glycerophosphodiester phosphodiesterase, partial [Rubrivirga sp.]|uniref:glycerophosphodiester phosphodiesterase n=1 Tax=Rubrivirga sp. TaxID=1885344 RepID=UPI003C70D3C0